MKYHYSIRKVKKEGKINGRGWKWVFWPFHKENTPVIPAKDQTEMSPFEAELVKLGSELLIMKKNGCKKTEN